MVFVVAVTLLLHDNYRTLFFHAFHKMLASTYGLNSPHKQPAHRRVKNWIHFNICSKHAPNNQVTYVSLEITVGPDPNSWNNFTTVFKTTGCSSTAWLLRRRHLCYSRAYQAWSTTNIDACVSPCSVLFHSSLFVTQVFPLNWSQPPYFWSK
jgi:hypothetical protein